MFGTGAYVCLRYAGATGPSQFRRTSN
jgi:hypothetical protein